ENFETELGGLEKLCRELTGHEMAKIYRPPEGSFTEDNLKIVSEMGYKTIFWSYAYADWDNDKQPDPESSLKKLLAHVHNGEILLLHPTSATNAAILDRFLTELEAEGYRFGSIRELCGL
ncbi:MAG: delta-lactam-biosynthetic de-N-acetylase, partial [Candidatus Flemingiibacterium sp.]